MFALALLVVLLDQLTKYLINGNLPLGDSLPLIPGVLHITHVDNPGAAFGLFQNQRLLLIIISLVAIAFILLFHRRSRSESIWVPFGLGLALGGAIGNLIDRIIHGKVTDFIDFRIWPVFNLADASVVIGLTLLAYCLLIGKGKGWGTRRSGEAE
ncbi:MAG: Lipoprotein signal peptidase [Actinobacteria bacterium]|nr:Lipoprotein signal peptidase [Actinomycetota bacterium]